MTHACLPPLKFKLEALLKEWPDNPILCQLREIALRILNLPITTALKKVLTGMELLLARAQIWEETACSSVSLTTELKQVSGLITRWQRMELESWRTALDRFVTKHAQGAHKTWFYLFRILTDAQSTLTVPKLQLRPLITRCCAQVDKVSVALEEYLTTSSQGEFRERILILEAFQKQLRCQGHHLVSNVIHNLTLFYNQHKSVECFFYGAVSC